MPARPRLEVTKQNGELEPFRHGKLRRSLLRAGASDAEIRQVVAEVEAQLHDGISTRQVYRTAHRTLRRLRRPAAARYSLKRAIQELGPTGHPFEHLVAGLLAAEQQRPAITSQRLQGTYVRHEIDVVVGNGAERDLYECKFRSQTDGKVDVKVAMYVYGRATDLQGTPAGYRRFGIATNGRFTSDAVQFGTGMGLDLLGWDHPKGDGLQQRIDRLGLHPITTLPSLPRAARKALLSRGVVLCQELRQQPRILQGLGLRENAARRLAEEIQALCAGGPADRGA